MKTVVNNIENFKAFYTDNYANYLNECIKVLIKKKSNDIELVIGVVTDRILLDLDNRKLYEDYEEDVQCVMNDIRIELVNLYNIWYCIIEDEL